MKKYILLLIAIIAFFPAYTQENPCIPDVTLQDSTFGLWPDTIQNLPIAQKDTYYEANIHSLFNKNHVEPCLRFLKNISVLKLDVPSTKR